MPTTLESVMAELRHCAEPHATRECRVAHIGEEGARLVVAEIERAYAAIRKVNADAERFERGWYLRGDALEKLQAWAEAYPLEMFPEPDLKRAEEVLLANGMTLGAISAHAMRHVIEQTKAIVAEGLAA